MKVPTYFLTGSALDWAVAKCEGIEWEQGDLDAGEYGPGFAPSANWFQAGSIIEREFINLAGIEPGRWEASGYFNLLREIIYSGPTPLVAAMRCYVASKLGGEVDIPEELAACNSVES